MLFVLNFHYGDQIKSLLKSLLCMEMNAGTLFSSWVLTSPFFSSAGWTLLPVAKYQQLHALDQNRSILPSHFFYIFDLKILYI